MKHLINPAMSQLTRLSEVRSLARRYDIHPSRALGQNFLIDANILDILLTASGCQPGDDVLEVGPGMGVVTAGLIARGMRVFAIEKDYRLCAFLRENIMDKTAFNLIEGDALELAVPLVREHRIRRFVSNLPYNPGSRILLELVCADVAPETLTVTVQLEVAERLSASAGGRAYGLLGLWCQLHYAVSLAKVVSPNCFWPRPAIRSAIVHLRRREDALLAPEALPRFYAITRYAFQHRRKQLVSLLTKAPTSLKVDVDCIRSRLAASGYDDRVRPEDVPVSVWCELAR